VTASGRARLSLIVVVACLVALIGTGLWVVDDRARARAERGLDRCNTTAQSALKRAYSPVVGMNSYVRPVLDSAGSARLRRDMYALVSEAAAGTASELNDAVTTCREVNVLWSHRDLRVRRAACLRQLQGHQAFLQTLEQRGRTMSGSWPTSFRGC
jgi:hypothetical protein